MESMFESLSMEGSNISRLEISSTKDESPRTSDQEYKNWIQCIVALNECKNRLFLYVDRVVRKLHTKIKETVITQLGDESTRHQCGDCSWRQIHREPGTRILSMNCKNRICSVWLNEILKYHVSPRSFSIFFIDANTTMWPSDPYEVARLFVPQMQRHLHGTLEDLDLMTMFLMIKYCTIFHSDLKNPKILDEIVSIRNNLHHSKDLRVADADKEEWIAKLQMFISDLNIQGKVASELTSIKALTISVSAILVEVQVTIDTVESLTMMELTNEEKRKSKTPIEVSMDGCKLHAKALNERLTTKTDILDISMQQKLLKVWEKYAELRESFHRWDQKDQESSGSSKANSNHLVSEKELANMIKERKFQNISEMIKSSRMEVKHVWVGYRKGSPEIPILIVVLFNVAPKISREDLPKPFHAFECLFRHEYEVSDEAYNISNDKMKWGIEERDRKQLETIHDKIDELLKKHSNIEMVSISGVRSRNYGSSDSELIQETCIVIYVHIKGLIPIGEEEFQCGDLDFPIDVQEGKFFFYDDHRTAKEYHHNLVMGCQIVGKLAGTLGGFLDLPHGGVACLTCAHLFLTEEDITNFLNSPASEKRRETFPWNTVRVGQPDHMNDFGTVRSIILRPGSSTEVGIDAAIITFTDNSRLPTSGRFPKHDHGIAGYQPENAMQFRSGKCLEIGQSNTGCEVLKFGASTDVTRGLLSHDFLVVGQSNIQKLTDSYTLYNQIAVSHLKDCPGFALHGDSGALVFMANNGDRDDLAAIGMVVGGNTAGETVVTPIMDILKAFKFDRTINTACFKSFGQYCPTQKIVSLEDLKREQEQQNERMNRGFKETNDKIDKITEMLAKVLQEKK